MVVWLSLVDIYDGHARGILISNSPKHAKKQFPNFKNPCSQTSFLLWSQPSLNKTKQLDRGKDTQAQKVSFSEPKIRSGDLRESLSRDSNAIFLLQPNIHKIYNSLLFLCEHITCPVFSTWALIPFVTYPIPSFLSTQH